jgi:urea transporter
MKQLNNRKAGVCVWIGNALSCIWQGLEAVSGEILFV